MRTIRISLNFRIRMYNWLLFCFEWILSTTSHKCTFVLVTKDMAFSIFRFCLRSLPAIKFLLPYPFTPSFVFSSMRNVLCSHVSSPFDQSCRDGGSEHLVWPSVPVRKYGEWGLHPAWNPLSIQPRVGLHPYWPGQMPTISSTRRLQLPLRTAFGVQVQARVRLWTWNMTSFFSNDVHSAGVTENGLLAPGKSPEVSTDGLNDGFILVILDGRYRHAATDICFSSASIHAPTCRLSVYLITGWWSQY